MAARNAFVYESAVFVQRFVRLRHDVSVLFVRRQIIHVIGYDARIFIHSSVRAHNKAVFVYFRKRGKRGNQTDVLTFGRFDRAHTPVMRVVNIAHFEGCAIAVQAAGTERGKFTLVRQFRNRVRLIHKLGKLRRTEKFADHRRYGADIDESGSRNLHRVLRSHSFLDQSFKAGNTHVQLILKQFAYGTHAAVAEVVDVIDRADAVF